MYSHIIVNKPNGKSNKIQFINNSGFQVFFVCFFKFVTKQNTEWYRNKSFITLNKLKKIM